MKKLILFLNLFILITVMACVNKSNIDFQDEKGKMKILIVKDPYSDSRTGPEILKGPDMLDNNDLKKILDEMDCYLINTVNIKMPEELNGQYGEWNRASLTNNVLNKTISGYDKDELFIIGLLSGSKSLAGMLGGLQHMGPDRQPLKDSRNREIIGLPRLGKNKPLKVGLIWISSAACFNTPDITLEGNMGGMNVAVSAGLCNTALRLQAGLDPPVSTKHIVMLGVGETNPYEEHNIDNSFINVLKADDIRNNNKPLKNELKRLSGLVDIIYVHVDLSILGVLNSDSESGEKSNFLSVGELNKSLELIFGCQKTAALGIASCPDNPDENLLQMSNQIAKAALEGIKNR